MSEAELKARVDELEKKLTDLTSEHKELTHRTVKQFVDHVTLQQRQIGSLRGPEGPRGESVVGPKGADGRDGKDGMSAAEIQGLVEQGLQDFLAQARKEVAAELVKFQTVVADAQKNLQVIEARSKATLADVQKSLQAQIEAFRARLQNV